ncbi:MAG: LytTR family DNA-binding domain-containing protein [Flavobacteriales bacterium]|nr:LytTR family DNA-binding domain-containing protein [Flavobacteriales bacterium]
MKLAVIDNENEVRKGIVLMLQHNFPEAEIVEADGVATGLQLIATEHPELIFLDVEMNDGTGLDLLRKVEHRSFEVIFITAFAKYAIEALRLSAIDYLLKPVDPLELVDAVNRAIDKIDKENMGAKLELLEQNLKQLTGGSRKILLKDQDSIHLIKIDDIMRCEADANYTRFFIANRPSILVSKNLKEYEDLLGDHFIRVHNSHLVNISFIVRIDKNDGGSIRMSDGENIPVSVRKREKLLEHLKRF